MANRPNILKLATKISLESMTYTGITYNDPEYKILEPIVTDDMCATMMHMRLETPRTVEEIARRSKKSVEFTAASIEALVKAGIVRPRNTPDGVGYYYPIWVPGIMEGMLSNNEMCEKYPILGECFEEYTRRRIEMLAPMLGRGMSFMRVMPVMSAIENNTKTASYDEISTLIENAEYISVGPCSCRRSRRLMGEGCGHLEDDMCMYLNSNALTYSKNGEHRLISKEEAYEVLKRAEDNGLVHEINQAPGFEDATAICNCCGCSCFSLRIAEYFRKPDGMRSNYKAVVDRANCVACGQCVENCQTNALKLGQKLCEINPTEHVDVNAAAKSSMLKKSTYNVDFRTNRTDVTETGTSPARPPVPLISPYRAT